MLGDVLHMTIDNASFAVNLYAQISKDRSIGEGSDDITMTEIWAAFLSGGALIATTLFVVHEGEERLIPVYVVPHPLPTELNTQQILSCTAALH